MEERGAKYLEVIPLGLEKVLIQILKRKAIALTWASAI